MITELAHYLSLLRYKPGALPGSQALAQARKKGQWPDLYDQYWQALFEQNTREDANRLFVDFLWWARDFEPEAITLVLTQALVSGCYQLDSIQLLMRRHLNSSSEIPRLPLDTLGHLATYEKPPGALGQYDQLLTTTGVSS